MMKLYYARTMHPRKACAVARYLGSPVQFVDVDLARGEQRAPAFVAKNPNAKVPLLEDGELVLWESNAIMCYLAHQAGSPLWPRDERQFEVLRWLNWDACEFAPHAGALYFEHVVRPTFGLGAADAAAVERATEGFLRTARILDDHLKDRRYLTGDALSVADFAVGITLPWAEAMRLPLEYFPAVRRWHARLEALDAWREPFPPVR